MGQPLRLLHPQEMIQLSACLPPGTATRFDVKTAIRHSDWEKLLQHIKRRNLAALLLNFLERESLIDQLPAGIHEQLTLQELSGKLTLRRYEKELHRLCTSLKEIYVKPLILKGGTAGPLYYERPELRLFKDIDMLILSSDIIKSVELFHELGYLERRISWDIRPRERIYFDRKSRNLDPKITMTYRPEGTSGEQDYSLDLHWHPFEFPGVFSKYGSNIPETAFFEAAIPHPGIPDLAFSPCPEDHLIHLGIQMIVHDKSVQIYRLADALRIVRHPKYAPNLDKLEERAKAFRVEGVVYYLCHFLKIIFGADIVPEDYVNRMRPAKWRIRILKWYEFDQLPDPLDSQFRKNAKRAMEMLLVTKSLLKIPVLYLYKLKIVQFSARMRTWIRRRLSNGPKPLPEMKHEN